MPKTALWRPRPSLPSPARFNGTRILTGSGFFQATRIFRSSNALIRRCGGFFPITTSTLKASPSSFTGRARRVGLGQSRSNFEPSQTYRRGSCRRGPDRSPNLGRQRFASHRRRGGTAYSRDQLCLRPPVSPDVTLRCRGRPSNRGQGQGFVQDHVLSANNSDRTPDVLRTDWLHGGRRDRSAAWHPIPAAPRSPDPARQRHGAFAREPVE